MFPSERPRRLRRTPALRRLVAETTLSPSDFVAPLFVAEALSEPRAIGSLPGHFQHTVASLRDEVRSLVSVGVKSVILFGVPATKDDVGSSAWDPQGVAQVALRALRDDFGDEIVLMADLCLDEYTSHGHCGVLRSNGTVDNDATIELYGRVAIAQASAGASVVAPRDSTVRFERRSTSTLSTAAIARATSRTIAIAAKRCARRAPTSPRVPTS